MMRVNPLIEAAYRAAAASAAELADVGKVPLASLLPYEQRLRKTIALSLAETLSEPGWCLSRMRPDGDLEMRHVSKASVLTWFNRHGQ